MTQEPDIKRWTAKRKAELIKQIYRKGSINPTYNQDSAHAMLTSRIVSGDCLHDAP